jgi:ubiquitin carboxyl-terminal hydrolase 34
LRHVLSYANIVQIFDFLTLFPAREAFADGVMAGEARTEDLFPAGKLLQAKYAALALQSRLREQIRTVSYTITFALWLLR